MFALDFKSRVPIYEQLITSFKKLIIKGILEEDEQLPSVRTLAKQLTVNPNTIQKSYRELEREGYIYSIKGKGSFVSPSAKYTNVEKLKQLEGELKDMISEVMHLGITKEKILEIITEIESGKGEGI